MKEKNGIGGKKKEREREREREKGEVGEISPLCCNFIPHPQSQQSHGDQAKIFFLV